jgi:hypothetical protein
MDIPLNYSRSFQSKCENRQSIRRHVRFHWRQNRSRCFYRGCCFRCCSALQRQSLSAVALWSRNRTRRLTWVFQDAVNRIFTGDCWEYLDHLSLSADLPPWWFPLQSTTDKAPWRRTARRWRWNETDRHHALVCSLGKLNMLCIAETVSFGLPVMWRNRVFVYFSLFIWVFMSK